VFGEVTNGEGVTNASKKHTEIINPSMIESASARSKKFGVHPGLVE
jgi:hypothetical protein